jgi:hypothetical protein
MCYLGVRRLAKKLTEEELIAVGRKLVKNLYNVFTDYYDFATDPSGSYNSFSASNGDKTDDYVAAYKALSNLVN